MSHEARSTTCVCGDLAEPRRAENRWLRAPRVPARRGPPVGVRRGDRRDTPSKQRTTEHHRPRNSARAHKQPKCLILKQFGNLRNSFNFPRYIKCSRDDSVHRYDFLSASRRRPKSLQFPLEQHPLLPRTQSPEQGRVSPVAPQHGPLGALPSRDSSLPRHSTCPLQLHSPSNKDTPSSTARRART